jgi:hypothetical protein
MRWMSAYQANERRRSAELYVERLVSGIRLEGLLMAVMQSFS